MKFEAELESDVKFGFIVIVESLGAVGEATRV